MNNLYILIGAPGCGKSTWAKEKKALGWSVVSRDEIRYAYLKNDEAYFSHEKEVFDTFVNALAASVLSNKNTIADATNLNENSRTKLLKALAARLSPSAYNIIFIYFDTSYATCFRRNALRQGRNHVPDKEFSDMFAAQSFPSYNEIRLSNVKGVEVIHETTKI